MHEKHARCYWKRYLVRKFLRTGRLFEEAERLANEYANGTRDSVLVLNMRL